MPKFSGSARGLWIEILKKRERVTWHRQAPQGACGLKSIAIDTNFVSIVSGSARGLWIEIRFGRTGRKTERVRLRKGPVDWNDECHPKGVVYLPSGSVKDLWIKLIQIMKKCCCKIRNENQRIDHCRRYFKKNHWKGNDQLQFDKIIKIRVVYL